LRASIILGVSCFVLMLIVRFPARWISPLLPQGMHCEQLDGSAWHGSCAGLTAGGSAVGDLAWDLHTLQLLRARLDLRVDLAEPGGYLRGDVALGLGGALRGRDVTLDLPLTSALVSSLPAGAHARLQGRLSRIEWTGKFFSVVQGELDLQDLVGSRGQVFGNYQANFGPDAADLPAGVVHDTGGPLALDATLQLTHDPGYLLQGQVAARPSAAPEFADQLKYLGSADPTGRRPFSLAGTF
jgi:hypothetical protein